MKLLAIDPGPVQSAWLLYDASDQRPLSFGKDPNEVVQFDVMDPLSMNDCPLLAIEMVASYGMPVGREVFETCVWIGRFIERWGGASHDFRLVYRGDVKLHLCGTKRAKDPHVRQALIDKWGTKETAIGKKASPGPLYGIVTDVWSALAVAVTAAETEELVTA